MVDEACGWEERSAVAVAGDAWAPPSPPTTSKLIYSQAKAATIFRPGRPVAMCRLELAAIPCQLDPPPSPAADPAPLPRHVAAPGYQ